MRQVSFDASLEVRVVQVEEITIFRETLYPRYQIHPSFSAVTLRHSRNAESS
jgi:hypothetical protein